MRQPAAQVPDTAEVRIDPRTNTMIRSGVPSIVNPEDVHAIEEAVRLKERFGGEGLELLARSALERGDAADARTNAEAALRVPAEPAARALRLALLARALDRLDVRDSAAATYRRAAEALPLAREWLLLRAAGATEDVRARERMYAAIKNPATRARVPYTEAQTLERFGKLADAAAAYDSVGDTPSAIRLRLSAIKDEAQRTELCAWGAPAIRNYRGIVTGRIEPVLVLEEHV